jgi:hypothetical protein
LGAVGDSVVADISEKIKKYKNKQMCERKKVIELCRELAVYKHTI